MLNWYADAKRYLPWRRTRDPYAIWVSEIMLQQTRVAAAIPFYERFMARFPTVEALAAAPEAHVLAHWAGLGYYTRARNLHKAAKSLLQSHCAESPCVESYCGASFSLRGALAPPDTLTTLRALPGIGDYTAAAIGSIAFGLPVAAVDGNLLRVIARLDSDLRVRHASAFHREHIHELLLSHHEKRSLQ